MMLNIIVGRKSVGRRFVKLQRRSHADQSISGEDDTG